MAEPPLLDPFARLRQATSARVGLGRAGQGLPTAPTLAFQLAHARAQDAVYAALNVERLRTELGLPCLVVESAAGDRETYLQRPDLGRRLGAEASSLPRGDYDVAIVLADGLSANAVQAHAPAVVRSLIERLEGCRIAPIVIARQARVALGDEIGAVLGARLVIVMIGERPGLSSPDSLGAYLTFDPKPGRLDSGRNCVSNIRTPGGLPPAQAAAKIAWIANEASRLGFTGVNLKDRHEPDGLEDASLFSTAAPTPMIR